MTTKKAAGTHAAASKAASKAASTSKAVTTTGPARNAEAIAVHTRLLKCTLEIDSARAWWRHPAVDEDVVVSTQAYEQAWFGARSLDRVKVLLANLRAPFDAFPDALAVLRVWEDMEPSMRQLICHWHLQLSGPLYRAFTGAFLVERHDTGRPEVTRDMVTTWVGAQGTGRWTMRTRIQFASQLLVSAKAAGLVDNLKDPRRLVFPRVDDVALLSGRTDEAGPTLTALRMPTAAEAAPPPVVDDDVVRVRPTLPVEWVASDAALRTLCARLRGAPRLDVETTLTTRALCLVQLSWSGGVALIDVLEIPSLEPLAELLAEPTIEKVIHNAAFERSVLGRLGITIDPVVDTLALSRAKHGQKVDDGHGLKAVCARELGLVLDKAEQTSNWARRPLSARQQAYAAVDAEVLLRLRDAGRAEGRRRGHSEEDPMTTWIVTWNPESGFVMTTRVLASDRRGLWRELLPAA